MAEKKKTSKQIQNETEICFRIYCKAFDLPDVTSEVQFMKTRRFRFDFAFVQDKIAIEVEGGVWIGGRHTRGSGYVKDMEKYNLATIEGWRVLRFTPQQLKQKETYGMIKKLWEKNNE